MKLNLLFEGELYGHYIRSGGGYPIDKLINLVQANFIDWDVSDPKFLKLFYSTHPHLDREAISSAGGVIGVLVKELNAVGADGDQNPGLVAALIDRTQDSAQRGGIMSVKLDEIMTLPVSLEGLVNSLGFVTIGDVVGTNKRAIMNNLAQFNHEDYYDRLVDMLMDG